MEEKLIARIRKMLALANDAAATEAERDTALQMVYKLLAKHNLSMTDVAPARAERRTQSTELFYGRPWALTVCKAVAELFFCAYFVSPSSEKNMVHHYFVGKESNAITALEMARYLVGSIRKEARRRQRELSENMTWQRSFCLGAASRLWARVKELQKQESEATPGTALVLANLYERERSENKGWLAEQGVSLRPRASGAKKSVDVGAYAEGQVYGNSVSLNTQLR